MAIPVAALVAANLLPIVLPYIMRGIGGGVYNSSMAKTAGSGQPIIPAGGVANPANPNTYFKLTKSGAVGKTAFPITSYSPVIKPGIGSKIGGVLGTVGTLGAIAAPFILNAIGRTAQTAGNTAGAVAQAAGNVPGHIANMTSDTQRQKYGGTIFDALGGVASDLGTAAGVGLSGAGNVIGSVESDMANAIRMNQLNQQYMQNMMLMQQQMQNSPEMSAGKWGMLQRMGSAVSPARVTRGVY